VKTSPRPGVHFLTPHYLLLRSIGHSLRRRLSAGTVTYDALTRQSIAEQEPFSPTAPYAHTDQICARFLVLVVNFCVSYTDCSKTQSHTRTLAC
jgi:hypothetical protein